MEKNYKINSSQLLNFLNSKWKNHACSSCGQNNWHIGDEPFELRAFRGGDMIIGGIPIIPVIPITCNNCGNTMFVNAMVANVFSNNKEDGNSKE